MIENRKHRGIIKSDFKNKRRSKAGLPVSPVEILTGKFGTLQLQKVPCAGAKRYFAKVYILLVTLQYYQSLAELMFGVFYTFSKLAVNLTKILQGFCSTCIPYTVCSYILSRFRTVST